MPGTGQPITFRPFAAGDAEFCFKVRSEAFVRVFYDEVGPEVVAAGINADPDHPRPVRAGKRPEPRETAAKRSQRRQGPLESLVGRPDEPGRNLADKYQRQVHHVRLDPAHGRPGPAAQGLEQTADLCAHARRHLDREEGTNQLVHAESCSTLRHRSRAAEAVRSLTARRIPPNT